MTEWRSTNKLIEEFETLKTENAVVEQEQMNVLDQINETEQMVWGAT